MRQPKRSLAVALIVVVAVHCLPLPAAAGEPEAPRVSKDDPADALARRRHQLEQAERFIEAENFSRARRLLLELWRERPSYDVAALLGYVEYHSSNYTQAVRYIAFAIEHSPPSASMKTLEGLTVDLRAAQGRVATVRVSVNAPAAELYVDDQHVGSLPRQLPLFLDPGTHRIEARDGEHKASYEITVTAGKEYRVDLPIPTSQSFTDPVPSSEFDAPTSDDKPVFSSSASEAPGEDKVRPFKDRGMRRERKVILIAGGSVTAVAAGLTAGFAASGVSAEDEADRLLDVARVRFGEAPCSTTETNATDVCRDLDDTRNRRDALHRAANVSLFIAGTAAVSTAVLYLLWPEQESDPSEAIQVAPSIGHNGGALSLTGAF